MKKCACIAHAVTYLPPVRPTRARSTSKSAQPAIHSLPASRSWSTPQACVERFRRKYAKSDAGKAEAAKADAAAKAEAAKN